MAIQSLHIGMEVRHPQPSTQVYLARFPAARLFDRKSAAENASAYIIGQQICIALVKANRGVRAAPAFKTLDLRPAANVEFILRLICNVSSVVTQHPDVLGGEPVFAGTRVPAKSLFDHLEAGDSIEQFLEGFPSVKREQVIALLEDSKALVLAARSMRILLDENLDWRLAVTCRDIRSSRCLQ